MSSGRTLALVVALVATGCSSPFGADEVRELADARDRWGQRTFADYTFETRHDCFCPPRAIGPVRITVRQGDITSVTLLDSGEAVPADSWYTIEDLFERIPRLADEEGVEDLTAEYDPALGFPTSIQARYEEGILDAGHSYTVSAVGPAS